jgi:hypothetical protein
MKNISIFLKFQFIHPVARHKIGSVNVGRTSPLPVKPVEPVTRKSGEADVVVDVKSLNMEDVSDWMNKLYG